MTRARSAILAVIVALVAVPLLTGRSRQSVSTATLVLGTDDAFIVKGFEPRENLVGGGVLRWTQPTAALEFNGVGPGQVRVDLQLRDQRTEVTITANGAAIGTLAPGQRQFVSTVRLTGTDLILGIDTEGFETSSGRKLGAQFVSLSVSPADATTLPFPSRLLIAASLLLGIGLLAQWLLDLHGLVALVPPALLCTLAGPAGLWRSPWLVECVTLLGAFTLVSALVAWRIPGSRVARMALQTALLIGLTIHGALPQSPLVIQQDAQLHGNKLAEVARGNWFPTTRTDHKPPFEIPYGFSFYALLSPLSTSGTANVDVMRLASALSTAIALVALALAVGRSSASLAAATVLLWTFMPINIRTMGFGNLNNVFAQALFVLFLTGGVLIGPGIVRSLIMASLVLASATAHFSSFIVLLTLLILTLPFAQGRASLAFRPLLAGTFVAGCYYATFVPLIVRHVPRLLAERGGSSGTFDPWRLPDQVLLLAGWPLLTLVTLSLLSARARPILPLGRSLGLTTVLLGVAALVSPGEVRYMLAAAPLLAVVGASVLEPAPPRSDGFPQNDLTSIVDFRWLRAVTAPAVVRPLGFVLISAAVVQGALVLRSFLPLFAS